MLVVVLVWSQLFVACGLLGVVRCLLFVGTSVCVFCCLILVVVV